MTKYEIIMDMVHFYTEDPSRRAYAAGLCLYITPDGRNCAVGRWLIDPQKWEDSNIPTKSFDELRKVGLSDNDFKEEVRGHMDGDFWAELQKFHDWHSTWTPRGLNISGLRELVDLLNKYGYEEKIQARNNRRNSRILHR